MLYHLFYPIRAKIPGLGVIEYITFRTVMATLTAMVISFVLGPYVLKWLRKIGAKQPIRPDGPNTHFSKEGTPTMGGLLILIAVLLSILLWARLDNYYVWSVIVSMVGFGAIGLLDDFAKLKRGSKGLSGNIRIVAESVLAIAIGFIIFSSPRSNTQFMAPFFKNFTPDIGYFYLLLALVVIVGSANAVNLTDGLDGLAIGPVMITSGVLLVFTYAAGNIKISNYLNIIYVPGAGELAIACGALVGAGLGFLWFNTFPAQMFMGDVGSLSLGAVLGTMAVVSKQEFGLLIAGGIFVLETVSVIVQVVSFKLTGKRVFRMAPLHHHFELKGWPEPLVTVRFWIISFILALLALSTLKLR